MLLIWATSCASQSWRSASAPCPTATVAAATNLSPVREPMNRPSLRTPSSPMVSRASHISLCFMLKLFAAAKEKDFIVGPPVTHTFRWNLNGADANREEKLQLFQ